MFTPTYTTTPFNLSNVCQLPSAMIPGNYAVPFTGINPIQYQPSMLPQYIAQRNLAPVVNPFGFQIPQLPFVSPIQSWPLFETAFQGSFFPFAQPVVDPRLAATPFVNPAFAPVANACVSPLGQPLPYLAYSQTQWPLQQQVAPTFAPAFPATSTITPSIH